MRKSFNFFKGNQNRERQGRIRAHDLSNPISKNIESKFEEEMKRKSTNCKPFKFDLESPGLAEKKKKDKKKDPGLFKDMRRSREAFPKKTVVKTKNLKGKSSQKNKHQLKKKN